MHPIDDAKLLNQYWTERSEAAFSELVRRHLNLVYTAACRRLGGDSHRAQDVAQTVFAELARQARPLSRRTSLEGWLYTTTRNVALQSVRTEQRRLAREQAAMALELDVRGPEIDADQLRPVIDQVLDRLSDRDRELVLLRFFRGRAFGDIAVRYGISEDAARFRLNRALDRMRLNLAKSGITSTPAALALVLSPEAGAVVTDGMVHAVAAGALAKAASSGAVGGSIQFIQIMSSTKAAAVAAIVFACIGGLWVQREFATLQSTRSELAQRSVEYQAALAQLKTAQTAARSRAVAKSDASRSTDAPSISVNGAATSQNDQSAASATASKNRSANDVVNWVLSRNPEIRATLATWIKSALHASMAAFYRQTNLTPEQIAAFEDLQMQENYNMGPGAILTLRPEGKTIEQVDTDIRFLLGDAGFQQLQQFSQTKFLRSVSNGVAASVYETGTPLTAELADQLTQILADSSQPTGRPLFPKDVDWGKALSRAKGILAPAQFAALETLAPALSNAPGALNPAMPGTYGDGLNPSPFLYTAGHKVK